VQLDCPLERDGRRDPQGSWKLSWVSHSRKARGSYGGCLMLDAAASVKSPRRVCISECIAVCTNFGAGSLRIIFRSRAEGAWQGSRRKAPERGGVRLPRQAEAGGTSHRHPVSGPRGCRALPPHFPRCSLGAFQCGLMLASQVCRSCGCPRVAAGPHSISKDCAACPLHLLTAGRRQLVTYIGSGALTL